MAPFCGRLISLKARKTYTISDRDNELWNWLATLNLFVNIFVLKPWIAFEKVLLCIHVVFKKPSNQMIPLWIHSYKLFINFITAWTKFLCNNFHPAVEDRFPFNTLPVKESRKCVVLLQIVKCRKKNHFRYFIYTLQFGIGRTNVLLLCVISWLDNKIIGTDCLLLRFTCKLKSFTYEFAALNWFYCIE